MELNQSVQTQMEASQILHSRRKGFVSTLAEKFGEPKSSTLSELVDHFPDVTKPMFYSLIEEINNLISQVRKKIEQVEERDRIRNFQPPVSGEMIMVHFGLKPCREIGLIKEAIKEAILEGEIPNEFDAAVELMKKEGKALGLKMTKE